MSSMESSSSWRYISAVKRLSIVLSGTNLLEQILWRDIYARTWRIFSRESCCTLFRSFVLTIFIVEKTRSTAALLNGSNSSDSMKMVVGLVTCSAVALTFSRSLKTFWLTFLHMRNKCKIINVQRNNKASCDDYCEEFLKMSFNAIKYYVFFI